MKPLAIGSTRGRTPAVPGRMAGKEREIAIYCQTGHP
jgi:hypothetical protein